MESPEVTTWIDAQNEVSTHFLADLPGYDAMRERLDVLCHGSGGAKPRWMLVEEFAELYSFFAWALDM